METKKIGVTLEGKIPNLIEMNQSQPLEAIISDLCNHWRLDHPEDYALQWDQERPCFVTERNRADIKDGDVLKLTASPAKLVQIATESLNKGSPEEVENTLKSLADYASDITYAEEFIKSGGLKILIRKIEEKIVSQTTLGYALKAFVELMDHGIVSWDLMEPKFIKEVANCVNYSDANSGDATALQMALEILESVVTHSTRTGNSIVVEQEVTAVTLTDHLAKTQNPETQKSALALINALFLKADSNKRKKIAESMQSKSIRTVILNNVIRRMPETHLVSVDAEMSHQLYVLQTLLFNLLEERKNTKADPSDQATLNCIKELRRLAFDLDGHSDSVAKKQNYVKDYQKLGFRCHSNPVEDFMAIPPGLLALDNMIYFAKHHQEEYTKVVLENTTRADDHNLPVAEASIEMTKVLCDVLKVGEPPTEDGRVYYPMLFTHEKPFEELFCICLQLLNKTWKEMRAAAADFPKVLGVAQEQITRTMEKCADNFERFKNHLWSLSYSELNKIWLRDQKSKEELESKAKPIVELCERIKPEILDLIKQQRLNYLVEGSRFYSRLGRKGERYWYCCLSPNHKVLYYGECEENVKPTIEQLKNKLAVVDIKRLLTGKDCPHVKEKRKIETPSSSPSMVRHSSPSAHSRLSAPGKTSHSGPLTEALSIHNTASLSFSIQTEAEIEKDPLNFIASDQTMFDMWTDGINALIGNPMTSSLAQKELDMLLSMEIKIRLLDTEGITIPKTPPPIPEEPPNYDFAYDSI